MSRTRCPSRENRRAHSWAPEHASIPIRHGGHCAMSSSNFPRPMQRRSTTQPSASTPCTENTFFARSIPTVVTSLMGLPLLVIEHAHTRQSWHFDAISGRGSPLHSLGCHPPVPYRCATCGKEHDDLPDLGFRWPDPYFGVPEAERPTRIQATADTC